MRLLVLEFCLAALIVGGQSSGLPFAVCIHTGPGDDLNRVNTSFQLISAVGAVGIRTDVFWGSVQPSDGPFDPNAIAYYRSYFALAYQNFGSLNNSVLILSGPPAWATTLFKTNKTAFLESWESFVTTTVAAIAKPLGVKLIQVWNEPNGIPSLAFASDVPAIITAGAAAVRSVMGTSAQIVVNPNCDMPLWDQELAKWCNTAGDAFDIIGVDTYPGTWRSELDPQGMYDWSALSTIIDQISTPTHPCYGKKAQLTETGFSSWSTVLHAGETEQANWMTRSLPLGLKMILDHATVTHELAIVYELYDEGSPKTFPPEEAHFGLVKQGTPPIPKPAFYALQQTIANFSQVQFGLT